MTRILTIIALINAVRDDSDDLHENNWAAAIVVLLVFAFVVWKVLWPAMKDNNVFMKINLNHYGRSAGVKEHRKLHQRDTIGLVTVANLASCLWCIHRTMRQRSEGEYFRMSATDHYPESFFHLTMFLTFALFIYTLINDSDYNLFRNFKYAFKVWMSTLFVAPIFFILINGSANYLWIGMYFTAFIYGNGFGCITFCAILWATRKYSNLPLTIPKKRIYILLITQGVLLFNFLIVAFVLQTDFKWLLGWLPYAVIMGLCIKYFEMDPTVVTDNSYDAAEVIE